MHLVSRLFLYALFSVATVSPVEGASTCVTTLAPDVPRHTNLQAGLHLASSLRFWQVLSLSIAISICRNPPR